MADNMRAKKVEEDGTPKSRYFESTLIASNKPTPDLKKRANASHRKHNKVSFEKKNIESKGDTSNSMELGEVNMDDVQKEGEKETCGSGNVEVDVDMRSIETCAVEEPCVVDNEKEERVLQMVDEDDGDRLDEGGGRVDEDNVRIDDDGDRLDEGGDRLAEDSGRVDEDGVEERVENVYGEAEVVREEKKRKEPAKRREKLKDIGLIQGVSRTGPFEGGPQNNSLLTSFYDHVAFYVWYGKERKPLSLIFHSKKLREWVINETTHASFIKKLEGSQLMSLRRYPETCDRALVSAFVERWHEETSTFHLPFGEMTITLDDVVQITGLKTEGKFITPKVLNDESACDLVVRVLGVEREEIKKEMKIRRVKLEWLKSKFATKMVGSEEELTYCVRAYILFTIGCVLCPDKSCTLVSVQWLQYLEDVDNIADIPFGTLAEACLYHELNKASRAKTSQICGLIPLLEVWILEHIPNITSRGILDDYEEIDPRIRRWNPSFGVFGSAPAVVNYRQSIDALTCRDVIFCPYEAHRNTTRPLSEITFYQGFLRFLDRTVLYLPNRVMRQFGFRQRIPAMEPKYGDNLIKWKTESEMYVIVDDDRQKIIDGNSLDKGYIQWYEHHSHPRVQNIQHWSGPKLVASSIGQIDVEDLIKNTLTIKWKLKEIIESPRMSTAKMREQIQEAIDIIGDLNQEEADQISEDTSPRKKKKVADENNKKNKQVKGKQAKTKQKKKT